MVDSAAQARCEPSGSHLLLYDGVCGLCSRLLQFVLVRDRRGLFRFAALQSATGRAIVARAGGDPDDLDSFYAVANYATPQARTHTKSRAGLFVLGELGWPWSLARPIGLLPTSILDLVYDLIARYRYRVFGRYDQCLVPRPEFRNRFVE
jgi:predicted DCC family thiol-disulfide oxidoreductase YuxK